MVQKTCIDYHLPSGTELIDFPADLLDATVVERPNRFVVIAEYNGEEIKCHLHDPGRLKELIFPGNRIKLRRTNGKKTNFSVLAALEGSEWVITDSRFHSEIARKFLPGSAKAEVRVGERRLDFLCEDEYIEVKGATLLVGAQSRFPDAPSVRASHHVNLLTSLRAEGHKSSIIILVMRKGAECFTPNKETDPVFSAALLKAASSGVNVYPLKMHFDGKSMIFDGLIGLCERT